MIYNCIMAQDYVWLVSPNVDAGPWMYIDTTPQNFIDLYNCFVWSDQRDTRVFDHVSHPLKISSSIIRMSVTNFPGPITKELIPGGCTFDIFGKELSFLSAGLFRFTYAMFDTTLTKFNAIGMSGLRRKHWCGTWVKAYTLPELEFEPQSQFWLPDTVKGSTAELLRQNKKVGRQTFHHINGVIQSFSNT